MGWLDRFFGSSSRAEFARQFCEVLRGLGDPRDARFDPRTFRLHFTLDGADAGTTELTRSYADYRRSPPKEREHSLRFFAVEAMQADWKWTQEASVALPKLRPQLQRRLDRVTKLAYLQRIEPRLLDLLHPEDETPDENFADGVPLGSHLVLSVAYQLPDERRKLTTAELAVWGLDVPHALEVAQRNLCGLRVDFRPLNEGVYESAVGDGLDACRILLTEALGRLALKGPPVAIIPAAETLLTTGTDDPAGLVRLFGEARQRMADSAHPMAPFLLRWDGTAWCDWSLPLGHVVYGAFAEWHREWWEMAYQAQAAVLEAAYARRGQPCPVSAYRVTAVTTPAGDQRVASTCTWLNIPDDQLLPRTEQVLLVEYLDRLEEANYVAWEQIAGGAPELLEQTPLYPPRFRVRRFPSPEQLQAIRAVPGISLDATDALADQTYSPTGLVPAVGDGESIRRIADHIARHVGSPKRVFHEAVSHLVHLDIHVVSPDDRRPYYTLITSGMSDRAMRAPPIPQAIEYAELLLCLPPDWPLTEEAFQDERNYWPIGMLKTLARYPHENDTWLGYGHTIGGDEDEERTDLCAALCIVPSLFGDEFPTLAVNPQKQIHFLAVVPLYAAEIQYEMQHGTVALLQLLHTHGVNELLDVNRACLC